MNATLRVGFFVSFLLACGDRAPLEHACSEAAAITAEGSHPLTGASAASKQLAFTFDDGPGSRTLELSAYLKSEGIRAVFFEVGHCYGTPGNKCNGENLSPSTVIPQLLADGHLVGNHTQDHKDLTTAYTQDSAGDALVVGELASADAFIAPYVTNGWFLFRAPFGSLGPHPLSVLQASPMNKYVGTINWDIGGSYTGDDITGVAADWSCWQDHAATTTACGNRYRNEIAVKNHGIVLMHDADYGDNTNHRPSIGKGNTVDMVKYMVPLLKAAGYSFIRADEVPAIRALLLRARAGASSGDAGTDAALSSNDPNAPGGSAPPSGGLPSSVLAPVTTSNPIAAPAPPCR